MCVRARARVRVCVRLLSCSLCIRCLVKNMVLGYVHATNRKKPEVLQLISRILDFSQEELDQVHISSGSSNYNLLVATYMLCDYFGCCSLYDMRECKARPTFFCFYGLFSNNAGSQ